MSTLALFQHLSFALAIGLLIGLERGWQEREEAEGGRVSGIRTFALVGLSGGIWGALFPIVGAVPLGFAFMAFAAAMTAFEWRQGVAEHDFSATGLMAGLLTFSLGALAVLGDMVVAGAAAVTVFGLLAEREQLHGFVRQISWIELRAFLVLMVMSFVLLPVLPDRAVDPWGAFNPHLVWLMTVLIAAISYAGYAAVRLAGARKGLLYAAAVGGLVSSTTVTLTYSEMARRQPDIVSQTAPAILLSWIVSLLRMTGLAAIIAPALLAPLLLPASAAVLVLIAAGALMWRRGAALAETPAMGLTNPFELAQVLRFGALLGAIMVGAKLLMSRFGEIGLLPLAAITGLADVDPITLSAARLTATGLPAREAALAILIAAGANLLAKVFVAGGISGLRGAAPLAAAGLAAIAAAGAIELLV